jgi:hypothetical protein
MLPSVLAQQLEQGLKDYLDTTFPVSMPVFKNSLQDLVNRSQALFKGPYISVKLFFLPSTITYNEGFTFIFIFSLQKFSKLLIYRCG